MALTYKLVTRKFTVKGEEKNYTYAVATKQNVCSLAETIALVEKISAVSSGDVKSVLDTLSDVMARQLAAGRIMDLGDLGRFRFTARSQAAKEGGDAFSRSNLQPPRTVYVPGKAVKLAAAQASYSFFDPTQKPESNNPADPNGTPGNASQGGDPSSPPGRNH